MGIIKAAPIILIDVVKVIALHQDEVTTIKSIIGIMIMIVEVVDIAAIIVGPHVNDVVLLIEIIVRCIEVLWGDSLSILGINECIV